MPTLVIDNVPVALLNRIHDLAKANHCTPADTALAMLEVALNPATPKESDAPLPQEPFLTEEICASFFIPWPKGTLVHAVEVEAPLPTPHDIPEED